MNISGGLSNCIYLDNAASTPVDPRVAVRMAECLKDKNLQGNPSSVSHVYGQRARGLVEEARAALARVIGAPNAAIVFTSGATESDNLAIMGAARFNADRGRHIVSARTEHKAVLGALKQLEREGFKVTYLQPDGYGIVHPEQVREALRDDTVLVSLMHVNNETGIVQDIAAVGGICRERGVIFHVDAAQSAGRLSIDVEAMGIDLLSLTAHKIYGPKGIGALYVRRTPPLGLEAAIVGGGQEGALRAGTLATHQIAGFGAALTLAHAESAADNERIAMLRERLWRGIAMLGDVELNGHPTQRVAGILNVAVHGVEGESLLWAVRELAVSAGAACATGSDAASYVLRALGRSDQQAQSSLRFSLGRFTTEADIDTAIAVLQREVPRLRALAVDLP